MKPPTPKHVELAPVHPRDVTPEEAEAFRVSARAFLEKMKQELRLSPSGLQALADFEKLLGRRPYRAPEVQSSEVPSGIHLLTCTGGKVDCEALGGSACCAPTAEDCSKC